MYLNLYLVPELMFVIDNFEIDLANLVSSCLEHERFPISNSL